MPKQPAVPSLRDAMEKYLTRRKTCWAEKEAFAVDDRAALPEGLVERRAATNATEDDAMHLLSAELVCSQRSDGRRDAL